jgi:hypothetical protein
VSTTGKRLDTMELRLTPKEWVIRLTEDMRSQPSEAEFVRVVAEQPYREWPWVKPYFKLAKRATERHPGKRSEDIRMGNQLDRQLRMEFHALKKLVFKANGIIKGKAETIGLKTGLKLSIIHTLILQDAIGRTARRTAAYVTHYKPAGAEMDEERLLKELSSYAELSLPPNRNFPSLIEECADGLVMLLMDLFAHRAAVREIQEKYFDEHPILFCDAEDKLIKTTELIEHTVSIYNGYLVARDALFNSDSNQEHHVGKGLAAILGEQELPLSIDIEAVRGRAEEFLGHSVADEWVKEARENAKADILQEIGEHEGYIGQTFRERVKP